MIKAIDVTKTFDGFTAVNKVNVTINEGSVFGLIGTNGAGKSTFLRMAAGVFQPDSGEITVDGKQAFENPESKKDIFYISDDAFYFPNATAKDMCEFYSNYYTEFDRKRFDDLIAAFNLDPDRKIRAFSKGMKKQLSVALGVSARTKYLFCDETFDGLDPVMRQAVKSIFAADIEDRGLTPVLASHNLRELEDICDHVGLLHKGGILLSKDLVEMKENIHKVQAVFEDESAWERLGGIEVVKKENRGRLLTITVRGDREKIAAYIEGLKPVYYEMIPLSLEEIFISETEVVGYDIKNLIF